MAYSQWIACFTPLFFPWLQFRIMLYQMIANLFLQPSGCKSWNYVWKCISMNSFENSPEHFKVQYKSWILKVSSIEIWISWYNKEANPYFIFSCWLALNPMTCFSVRPHWRVCKGGLQVYCVRYSQGVWGLSMCHTDITYELARSRRYYLYREPKKCWSEDENQVLSAKIGSRQIIKSSLKIFEFPKTENVHLSKIQFRRDARSRFLENQKF